MLELPQSSFALWSYVDSHSQLSVLQSTIATVQPRYDDRPGLTCPPVMIALAGGSATNTPKISENPHRRRVLGP